LRKSDCVCLPFRGWMGKRKYWSAFERGMVVGARHTGLCQELQHCWVFHNQQFPVCIKSGPLPKGHPATWHNCGEHWSLHGGVQLNIRKVFLMFCTFSVFLHDYYLIPKTLRYWPIRCPYERVVRRGYRGKAMLYTTRLAIYYVSVVILSSTVFVSVLRYWPVKCRVEVLLKVDSVKWCCQEQHRMSKMQDFAPTVKHRICACTRAHFTLLQHGSHRTKTAEKLSLVLQRSSLLRKLTHYAVYFMHLCHIADSTFKMVGTDQ
jgi:hypothetical protein